MKRTKKPRLTTWALPDYLRGNPYQEVTIRFDPDDTVELPCVCDYDPTRTKKVMLLREAEVRQKDGTWEKYPTVTWIDGAEDEEQLVSRALVRLSTDGAFRVMSSTQRRARRRIDSCCRGGRGPHRNHWVKKSS